MDNCKEARIGYTKKAAKLQRTSSEHTRHLAKIFCSEEAEIMVNSLRAVSLNIGLRATTSLRGKHNNRLVS